MPPSNARPRLPLRARKKLRAREHIVDTAYELFGRDGFASVTVADIVEAADVSRSTFFRYFGDKQEVVFAFEQELRETLIAEADATSAPPPRCLRDALRQLRPLAVSAYDLAAASPRTPCHERLVDADPELLDRHLRKLMRFADDMTALLTGRGADADVARLAGQLVVACCLAARGSATPGEMSTAVAERIDAIIDQRTRP